MKLFTSLIFLLLCCTACFKDNVEEYNQLQLPEKTQNGQHSFGFLLNNEVWVNFGQACTVLPTQCRDNLKAIYYESDGDIEISADRVLRDNNQIVSNSSLIINLKTDFRAEGIYSTQLNDRINATYQLRIDSSYILPSASPDFSIHITRLDLDAKILSGEFSGTLFLRDDLSSQSTSTSDSVRIENGRFDIRLK